MSVSMWNRFRRCDAALTVDRIVSLGALCEVAFQARRLSGSGHAYPFDWWITPLSAVSAVLEAGAAAAFAPGQIVKIADYGGKRALYSRLGGTVHLHEFAADEDFLALGDGEIAARLQEKYAALHARLLAACGAGATLFVRQHLSQHDPQGQALESEIDRLFARLCVFSPDPRLLLLDYPTVAARPWLIQAQVPRLGDHNDLGSRRGWNTVFRAAGIACRPSGGRFRYNDLLASFPGRHPG